MDESDDKIYCVEITKKKSGLCIENDCLKSATFNFEGETKRLYCERHKKALMINIRKMKQCKEKNCKIRPYFNFVGEKTGLYCSEHKQPGMVNVLTKKCNHNGCNSRPNYNFKGKTAGLFCGIHKLKDMVFVGLPICVHDNCQTIANYNFEDKSEKLFCDLHKKVGMVNIKSTQCAHENCETRASFNFIGQSPKFCKTHSLKNMVNVSDISKHCVYEGCETHSSFNFEGQTRGLYCNTHKLKNMVNVVDVNKHCKTPLCATVVGNKYKGYCLRCFIHTYPSETVSRNYKTKETAVADFVKQSYPELIFAFDKTVENGSSKKRPDILLRLKNQIIIVEVDENQHQSYDCSCENKRIMEISQDLKFKNTVFIRFNPDAYYDKDDNKITTCWTPNKKGILVVEPKKKEDWQNRLDSLKKQIAYWIKNKTSKMVETIELFYDENLQT